MSEWLRYARDCVRHPVVLARVRSRVMLWPTERLRDVERGGDYGDRGVMRTVLRRRPWAW